jgi:hypothetical protein
MTLKTVCAAVLLVAAVPATGTEGLRLRVSPEMCVEPAWIVVRATVEPDAENRVLEIVAESAEFLRSSRIQLDGANASRTSVFQYRDLPAGEYEVRGVVRGRDGRERAAARRTIRVLQ